MTPTNKLRFVERFKQIATDNDGNPYGPKIPVLQQWWEQSLSMNLGWGEIPLGEAKGEWRDIPTEQE